MNIYNDSSTSNSASYPTSPNFTNIDTQNILIHNSLAISGLLKGQILIGEDNLNDVGGLNIGDQDMILCSDKNNSGLPEWRNDITVNKITTNLINNVGVVRGDLLVGDITAGNIARLPIGANGYQLYSNGTECGWQNPLDNYQYFYFAGSAANVNTILNPIVGGNGFNLTNGQRYLATVSARIVAAQPSEYVLKLEGSPITIFNYDGNSDMSRTFLFTSGSAGAILIEVDGLTTAGTASLLEFFMWVMPF